MTETLSTALISLSFWSLVRFQTRQQRKYALLLALFSGVLILTRHSLAPISLALLAMPIIKLIKSRQIVAATLCLGILSGLVLPWIAYVKHNKNQWGMTVSTGWPLFVYQVITQFFDPSIESFRDYKSEYLSAVVSPGGQKPAWHIREMMEPSFTMAELDDKFRELAMENIVARPGLFADKALPAFASFIGLKSPASILGGESENILAHESVGALSRKQVSHDSVEWFLANETLSYRASRLPITATASISTLASSSKSSGTGISAIAG